VKSLVGKHIVITGASAGIGAELARQLCARGASLTLAARRLERLQALEAELERGGGRVQSVLCDVTARHQISALRDSAYSFAGNIDVWISNAGQGLRQRLIALSDEQLSAQYRLNCLSALYAYQALLPRWLEELAAARAAKQPYQRQFIDICSLGGKSGYAFNAAYSAAKHGMSALGDTLRQELLIDQALCLRPTESGIIATTVYPGPTVSDFGRASPDLTGGEATNYVAKRRANPHALAGLMSAAQPTALVARCVAAAVLRPVPAVYPHRWANLGVLLNNLAPRFVLGQLRRHAMDVTEE